MEDCGAARFGAANHGGYGGCTGLEEQAMETKGGEGPQEGYLVEGGV